MGYHLSAFISNPKTLQMIAAVYAIAKLVELPQNLSLIPFTEELYDQINDSEPGTNIQSFTYLTTNIEDKILKIINDTPIAYVEADYFGGKGGQVGVIWAGGKRIAQFESGQDTINAVLKHFGVIAEKGKDEFATLDFGRHRDTADWAE